MEINLNCFDWSECVLNSRLPSHAKYLALYLATFMNKKNDMAWPSQDRIAHDTGLTKPTIRKYLAILSDNEWLITKQKVRTLSNGVQNYFYNEYHISFPKELEHRVKAFPTGQSIGKTDSEHRENSSLAQGKEFTPNNNRITKNNNRGRFTPPTLEQVQKYCLERNNDINPQKFIDHYATTNWMRGKNKIKDWKACVRTWEKSTSKVEDIYKGAI